ncbi:MAG: OmpA family protein [Candidatus Electrothrix sp. AUS1_2]|nr:OmpA family protein [Candidatus Electrothrix sp. AUS1_2]
MLSGVNFTVGTAELTDEAVTSLRTTAKLLKTHAAGQRFEVAGYTDSMGSPQRNQLISEQRAQAVRNFLIEQGIDRKLLVSRGYGQKNPIADNNTSEGRAMNRRVELHQITAE